MRKSYLFLASTAILLASCANDELENGTLPLSSSDTQAIGFNLKTAGMTRATLSGSDAASKLNKEFVVYGTKYTGNDSWEKKSVAFQNYKVTWSDNSAGTSSSNSSNWEYVGNNPYDADHVYPSLGASTTQTIKYWDYSTAKYTFTAFSGAKLLEGQSHGKVTKIEGAETVSEGNKNTKYDKGYTVEIPATTNESDDEGLNNIFFSDRVEVEKKNYGNPVVLTFRNFGAKVRVGFYETVPGYSIKNLKFYSDSRDSKNSPVTKYADMKTVNNTNFVAALQNVSKTTAGNQVTVTYGDGTDGIAENQAKVIAGNGGKYQYTLTLGTNIASADGTGKDKFLGTAASTPTWDKTGEDNYTTVYPNLDNTTPMMIRCSYTLVADDNSGEEINVTNARVVVPAQYCQWKSNYAYTYLFKISENTNGTTGSDPKDPDNPHYTPGGGESSDDAPEGLFPITFDAVTVESEDDKQETITTIATNSVTTYAKESAVTKNNEYKAGETIYFVDQKTAYTESGEEDSKTYTHDVLPVNGQTANTAGNAVIYNLGTKAYSEAEIIANLTGSKISGLSLETTVSGTVADKVPSATGPDITIATNGVLSFAPNAAGYYAYVYCNEAYVAKQYKAATDWNSSTTYYFLADGTTDMYYVASNIKSEEVFQNLKSKLYVEKTSSDEDYKAPAAGSYDVKVVKVVK